MKNQNDLAAFCERLCTFAESLGATDTRIVSVQDVVLDERATLKCLVPRCANYSINLTCPPHNISFQDFERILSKYSLAILLRVANKTNDKNPKTLGVDLSQVWDRSYQSQDKYFSILREGQTCLYNMIERLESQCLEAGYYFAAGLSAGGCALCDKCVGQTSGKPCRYPFKARPSMEGLGIDVLSTARKAGINLKFNHQPASWVGLVLID